MDTSMTVSQQNPGPCDGFDEFAGRRWVYPNNMTIRGYQKQAVEKCLFNNSMIVLPTGFGKTFIAAVVMYNFYCWYPQGKIIFVAPTRPLVAQQITECKKISGIPSSDCVELTGQNSSDKRCLLWKQKRVFFATPQVVDNDLRNRLLPAKAVRCIVIDEAHRAQGDYAYVEIARQLHEGNRNGFRMVALSATPGSNIDRVRQVMLNLFIGDVMFRSENSIDLMQYKNEKNTRAWTVELPPKHKQFVDVIIKLTEPAVKELYRAGLTYSGQSIDKVAKYTLIKALKTIDSNEVRPTSSTKHRLKFLCSAMMTISTQFELLTLYGIRVFYSSVQRTLSESRSNAKNLLNASVEFEKVKIEIERMFGEYVEPNPNVKAPIDLTIGHPKLKVVKDLLFKHFQAKQESPDTRAIVFTRFRESVYDIVQTLKAYEPLIKPGSFVGQGGGLSAGVGGMSQKDQIKLINDFKAGQYNVIVATCVAEEGLDIGEVDLIICYDTTSSPISSVQRRGRTGRKRSGNVQTLVTKDFEEKKLHKAGSSRRQVEDQLYKRENYMSYRYKEAPRMVPSHITPVCMEIKIFPVEDEEPEQPEKKKRKKRTVSVPVVKKKQSDSDDDDDLFTPKKSNGKDKKVESVTTCKKEPEEVRIDDDDEPHQQQVSEPLDQVAISSTSQNLTTQTSSIPTAETSSRLETADSDIEWDDDFDLSQVKMSPT